VSNQLHSNAGLRKKSSKYSAEYKLSVLQHMRDIRLSIKQIAAKFDIRNYESVAQLLLTAGDNSGRLQSETSLAALRGVSPVPASLPMPAPKEYVARRLAEGHSKFEAIRCLKRYIDREVFCIIRRRQREINATKIAT
jgi:hypothetical protein